jgi:hypothetical protein
MMPQAQAGYGPEAFAGHGYQQGGFGQQGYKY